VQAEDHEGMGMRGKRSATIFGITGTKIRSSPPLLVSIAIALLLVWSLPQMQIYIFPGVGIFIGQLSNN